MGIALVGFAVLVLVAIIVIRELDERQKAKKEAAIKAEVVTTTIDMLDAKNWTLDTINGPTQPVQGTKGWVTEVPYPNQETGSLHSAKIPYGPLTGAKKMVITGKITGDLSTQFAPRNFPLNTPIMTPYFERRGNDMTLKTEAYRWYAKGASMPMELGEFTIEAPLDRGWVAVQTSTQVNNPQAFQEALDDTVRIGIVWGGGDGIGHGIYATGPNEIEITGIKVE